jgi:hypothetical protein
VLDLPPFRIDFLPEVAVPAEEAYEYDGKLQVGRGAHGIARENAQASCIGMNFDAQRELHREVRDIGLRKEGT